MHKKITINKIRREISFATLGIVLLFLVVYYTSDSNAQSSGDEVYDETNPQVETQVIVDDGSLEDISQEDKTNASDDVIMPNVTQGIDDENIFQSNIKNNSTDMISYFDQDNFNSITISLKNFSKQLSNEAKEDPKVLNRLDDILKDSDFLQEDADSVMENLKKRWFITSILFGPDYKLIKDLKIKSIDMAKISNRGNVLAKQMRVPQAADILNAYSVQLSAKNSEYEKKIIELENKKSLFGWLFKMLN
jgi:hypothetical protein